jgi:tRNA pseudouridine38-40 synthase
LQLSLMQEASTLLLGTHNFSSFTSSPPKNPICTLFSIHFTFPERKLQIELKGDRFLYKMARTLAGTLLYVGCGKLSLDCIPSLLSSPDRKKGGVTAPAHGLFLSKVLYSAS